MTVVPIRAPDAPLSLTEVERGRGALDGCDLLVRFSRRLTVEELIFFREVCERTAPLMDSAQPTTPKEPRACS